MSPPGTRTETLIAVLIVLVALGLATFKLAAAWAFTTPGGVTHYYVFERAAPVPQE